MTSFISWEGGDLRATFEGTFSDKIESDFDQSGPFIGAADGWRYDGDGFLNGSLLANFAIAFLDSEFKHVKRTPVPRSRAFGIFSASTPTRIT